MEANHVFFKFKKSPIRKPQINLNYTTKTYLLIIFQSVAENVLHIEVKKTQTNKNRSIKTRLTVKITWKAISLPICLLSIVSWYSNIDYLTIWFRNSTENNLNIPHKTKTHSFNESKIVFSKVVQGFYFGLLYYTCSIQINALLRVEFNRFLEEFSVRLYFSGVCHQLLFGRKGNPCYNEWMTCVNRRELFMEIRQVLLMG